MSDDTESMDAAEKMKELGNEYFRCKRFDDALECYNKAIKLQPRGSHLYYSNRSSCLAALGRWEESASDAQTSLDLAPTDPPFTKGYFRLAKAQIELQQFGAASESIAAGLHADGNNVDLKKLDKVLAEKRVQAIKTVKDPRRRPTPTELQTVRELGHGNFTRILEVLHRDTKETFALKVIEKSQIERVRKRHPNVVNEISMERRILSRLRHPNIIELYHAFQDYTSLYLLLEYCGGGEVWQQLQSNEIGIGIPLSMARFYTSEVIAAFEFLHGKGIIHRDVKPENMVLTSSGRLKLIDFGSAKDTVETDLNGPEFVGTPEYMSLEAIKSRETLMEGDLWALGCCIFQFLCGVSPFKAPSTYLIFLRAQRCNPRYPAVITPIARDLIFRLIRKLPQDRLGSFRNSDEESKGYEPLRAHPFFEGAVFGSPDVIIQGPTSREIALQELAQQCIAQAMQIEPDTKVTDELAALTDEEKAYVSHLLERQGKLTEPRILRFILPSGKARLMARIDAHGKEVFGLGLGQQQKYIGPFHFIYLGGLTDDEGATWSRRLESLQTAVQRINRLRPRFVVVSGDLMESAGEDTIEAEEWAARQEDILQALSRISESIAVLIVPSRRRGGSHYGFWYGGLRGLVLGANDGAPTQDEEEWAVEELEQGRFNAQHIFAFVPRPWIGNNVIEGSASPRLRRWALSKMQGRETRLNAILSPSGNEASKAMEFLGGKKEPTSSDEEDNLDAERGDDQDDSADEEVEEDGDDAPVKILQVITKAACIFEVYRETVVHSFMNLEEIPSSVLLKPETPDEEDKAF